LAFLAATAALTFALPAKLWQPLPQLSASVAAAEPPQPAGPDPFGFSARFDAEVKKIGQITPQQFAAKYSPPQYLDKLSWDPTTAKFFAELNVATLTKPGPMVQSRRDPKPIPGPPVTYPGYKLSEDELAKYKANGFVVSERLGGRSFGDVYYNIYTRDLPVFISADSILHAWHRSYDAMLEELEMTYLLGTLDAILTGMHESLPAAKGQYGAGVLKNSVYDADYFLAVARSLLMNGTVKTNFDQDDRVARTLKAVQAEGMHEFELFGRGRNMDFSQFKPRGHYETKPELRRYFKAMMWCGRTDLRISGGYEKSGPLSSSRELGSAMVLLDLLRKANKETEWRQFDALIQTFVGRTDSATFDDLAKVALKAKITSPSDLKTEADLEKLTEAVNLSDAGKQDIRGDVYVSPSPSVKVTLPRSFTLLGQKFVVDSWVTSKTIFDDIMWDSTKVQRRVPSCLDVSFAALGNNHIVHDLEKRMLVGSHRFRDRKNYQHNLAAVRESLDSTDDGAWNENLYMGWLKTLRTLTQPGDASNSEVTQTREWAMRNTNTQLASWAQLRHDSILYVKQSYTSGAMCYYPTGYVEPNVPFWIQMEVMAKRSAELLERTPFPADVVPTQKKQAVFFRNFAAIMGRVKTVAEKQSKQHELSAEETKVLQDVMQIVHIRIGSGGDTEERCTGWYPSLFYKAAKDCLTWNALVADVHTDVPCPDCGDPGSILHQGVGNVDLMIEAIDNGKDRVVYCGPTFSHYEFEMVGVQRKTDKEWKHDLLECKHPPRPEWTRGYLVPDTTRKPATPQLIERMLAD
jgi:hypothetical protein